MVNKVLALFIQSGIMNSYLVERREKMSQEYKLPMLKGRDYSNARLLITVFRGEYTVNVFHPRKSPRGKPFYQELKTFSSLSEAETFKQDIAERYSIAFTSIRGV